MMKRWVDGLIQETHGNVKALVRSVFLIHETGPIEAVELWLEELRHKYGGTEKFVDVVEKAVKAGLDLDPSQALIFLRTVLAQRDCNAERCLRAMRTVRCLQTTTTTLLTELKLTSADYSSIAELLATAVHFSGLKELEQFARESDTKEVIPLIRMSVGTALMRSERAMEAMEAFRYAEREGVQLTRSAYASILLHAARRGDDRLFNETEREYAQAFGSSDGDVRSLKLLLYARKGRTRLMEKVLSESSVVNVNNYNLLMSVFARRGEIVEVERILAKIPKPDSVSFSILATARAKSGDKLGAFMALERSRSVGVGALSVAAYNQLALLALKENDLEGAEKALSAMAKDGVVPDSRILLTRARIASMRKDLDQTVEALHVAASLMKRNPDTVDNIAPIVLAFSPDDDLPAVKTLLRTLVMLNYPSLDIYFGKAIGHCSWKDALDLLQLQRQLRVRISRFTAAGLRLAYLTYAFSMNKSAKRSTHSERKARAILPDVEFSRLVDCLCTGKPVTDNLATRLAIYSGHRPVEAAAEMKEVVKMVKRRDTEHRGWRRLRDVGREEKAQRSDPVIGNENDN